jgi:predicted regulator of Ras-like GTPase activity (Roadblock/LC7/MglB family)
MMEAVIMVKKRKDAQETTTLNEPIVIEETTPVNNLRASLEEIKNYEGVVGYILRNSTSASIDLKDPTRIIDYAILSSSAIDASKELAELFDLGDAKNIRVEGKNVKMLSLTMDESKISVFMDKNAVDEKILRRLRAP